MHLMQVEEIFGRKIARAHCNEPDFYTNIELQKSCNRVFALPEIQDRYRGAEWDSHEGNGESTEGNLFLGPDNLIGSSDLMQWIKSQCVIAAKLAWNIDATDVTVTRSWMNRMNKGSKGKCHKHSGSNAYIAPTMVAIFYVSNTDDGASLVIVNDGVHGLLPEEFPSVNTHSLITMPGDLVIHDSETYHAISEHKGNEPRVCFVFHMEAVV